MRAPPWSRFGYWNADKYAYVCICMHINTHTHKLKGISYDLKKQLIICKHGLLSWAWPGQCLLSTCFLSSISTSVQISFFICIVLFCIEEAHNRLIMSSEMSFCSLFFFNFIFYILCLHSKGFPFPSLCPLNGQFEVDTFAPVSAL